MFNRKRAEERYEKPVYYSLPIRRDEHPFSIKINV